MVNAKVCLRSTCLTAINGEVVELFFSNFVLALNASPLDDSFMPKI